MVLSIIYPPSLPEDANDWQAGRQVVALTDFRLPRARKTNPLRQSMDKKYSTLFTLNDCMNSEQNVMKSSHNDLLQKPTSNCENQENKNNLLNSFSTFYISRNVLVKL